MADRRWWIAALIFGLSAGAVTYFTWQHVPPAEVALAEAWSEVRRRPQEPQVWAVLGDAQSSVDQLGEAEESYRTALRLSPDHPQLLARLGFLLYGRGKDPEALELLERARVLGAEVPMLGLAIAQLRADQRNLSPSALPSPVVPSATGAAGQVSGLEPFRELPCAIPLQARGTFRLPVSLNGTTVPLIFDTGASITTLSQGVLETLGVPIDDGTPIHAITATGSAQFSTAVIDEVQVAGRSLRHLTVAVCNECGGQEAGGLLGLDVQAALGLELDLRGQQVRFHGCTGSIGDAPASSGDTATSPGPPQTP